MGMHETCMPCIVCNFLYSYFSKCYASLQFYSPVVSSFLYVTLLIFPWLMEIIILSQYDSTLSFVNTIMFCATFQTGLSISSAINMGYNFFCCCVDRRMVDREVNEVIRKSSNHVWRSSPMKMSSIVSPGYIVYIGVPWLLVNIFALAFLPDDMCFSSVLYLMPFMPLIVYFPCFAIGSSYRNLMEGIRLDNINQIGERKKEIHQLVKSDVKCDTDNPSPIIGSDVHIEPLKSVVNQQLYDNIPLMLSDVIGRSSKTIFVFMRFGSTALCDNPVDADDFERNRALLLCYPEWKERILKIGILSKQWKVLSENWGQIERLYEKDYLIHHRLIIEGECNKYIHKLLKEV